MDGILIYPSKQVFRYVNRMANQQEIDKGASLVARAIALALSREEGCLIGRNGTVELETVFTYLEKKSFPQHLTQTLERNAGVFPQRQESLVDWANEYIEANRVCDLLALGWYAPLRAAETRFLGTVNPHVQTVPLRSLEPYYVDPVLRWTNLLAGRHVAVVNSFTETMKRQLARRNDVWGANTESLLPSSAQFSFFQTGYAPNLALGTAGWNPPVSSWKEAIDRLETEILASGARIVLIGCGGLGFPLAQRLRRAGKIVIVLGGAIQVLFGIKGERWAAHSVISKFWNSSWVYPSEQETPRGAMMVEAACYWASKRDKIESI